MKTLYLSLLLSIVSLFFGCIKEEPVKLPVLSANSDSLSTKSDVSTSSEAPIVSTKDTTNVSLAGATLNGTVNANGFSTTVTFEYGTTTSYGSTVTAYQSPVTGNSITNVSANISVFIPVTTYHFRVKAENSHGIVYGDDKEFKFGHDGTGTGSFTSTLTGLKPSTTYYVQAYFRSYPIPTPTLGNIISFTTSQ
jgi:hypothetical protein